MYLNFETMRELLSKCLFGDKWQKNIDKVIPRKGNFLNPQYLTDTGTYAVYYIDKKEKRLQNFTQTSDGETEATTEHYASMLLTAKVQFIGQDAEKWATSLLFWDERSDVSQVFLEYQAQLLPGNRLIQAVPFQQEGENGEMSYLASFDAIANATKKEIEQYLTDLVIFTGGLTVEK